MATPLIQVYSVEAEELLEGIDDKPYYVTLFTYEDMLEIIRLNIEMKLLNKEIEVLQIECSQKDIY